jgi:LacI family transcriptional regulator, galactose operon repressor
VGTPSVKEVAALAGVSLGTVSNVLNRPDRVSYATRTRVHAAIDELGFVRNESARALRTGRTNSIAYVCLDAANPFFTDVARGVEDAAAGNDTAVYLCDSGNDAAREDRYLDRLEQQRMRGVLVTPVNPNSERLRRLPQRGTPVVLVDRGAGRAGLCSVSVDDVHGGELAVSHLVDRGHERLAYVGGPLAIGQVADRLAGAGRALVNAGHDPAGLTVVETAAPTISEGRDAATRIAGLRTSRRPSGVFCANDLLALGLLQQMTRMGVDVPRELAIVGYDDIEFAGAAAVPLSSVRQPRQLLGRTAAELLFAESGSDEAHVHQQVLFHPELVVRASSIEPNP